MGGQILDYEAKRIWKSGYAVGYDEGRRESRKEIQLSAYLSLRRDGYSVQKAQSLATLPDELITQAETLLAEEANSN